MYQEVVLQDVLRTVGRFETPQVVAGKNPAPALRNEIHGGPPPEAPCLIWSAAYNLLLVRKAKHELPVVVVASGFEGPPKKWLCAKMYGHYALLTPFEPGSSSFERGASTQTASQAFQSLHREVLTKPAGIQLSIYPASTSHVSALEDLQPALAIFDLAVDPPIKPRPPRPKAGGAAAAVSIADVAAVEAGVDGDGGMDLEEELADIMEEEEDLLKVEPEPSAGAGDAVEMIDRDRAVRESERRCESIARRVSMDDIDLALRRVYEAYAEDEGAEARAPTEATTFDDIAVAVDVSRICAIDADVGHGGVDDGIDATMIAEAWSDKCANSLRALAGFDCDVAEKTGHHNGHMSLVITKTEPREVLWIAWMDWAKTIGQRVTLDSQRRPLWMPASFYPGCDKREDFSNSNVLVWNIGVQLVKLRSERVPVSIDMMHLFKFCVFWLDCQHTRDRSHDGIAPWSCEACGSGAESGGGRPQRCVCCLLDLHPACAVAIATSAKSRPSIATTRREALPNLPVQFCDNRAVWHEHLCALCALILGLRGGLKHRLREHINILKIIF